MPVGQAAKQFVPDRVGCDGGQPKRQIVAVDDNVPLGQIVRHWVAGEPNGAVGLPLASVGQAA